MKLLISLYSVILFTLTYAQAQNPADSLQSLLKSAKEDTSKVNILNNLSRAIGPNDMQKSFEVADQALKLAQKLGYKKGEARAYMQKGFIPAYTGKVPEGIALFQKSLKLYRELGIYEGMTNVYNALGNVYRRTGAIDKAVKNYKEALEVSRKGNYPTGVANAYFNLGIIHQNQGEYPKALENYQQALKVYQAEKHQLSIANTYTSLGVVYSEQGNYAVALEYYQKSLKISEAEGRKNYSSTNYNNIGVIYENRREFDKALENYQKALKIAEEINWTYQISLYAYNIGSIYLMQQKLDKALEYYQKTLKISNEIGNKSMAASTFKGLGEVFMYKKAYKKSLENFQKALLISREIQEKNEEIEILNGLAQVYLQQQQATKARDTANQAYTLATNIGNKNLIKQTSQTLSKIYQELKDYQKAFEYHQIFKQQSDSLLNADNIKKITGLELQYEYEKEKELARLKQQQKDALVQAQLRSRRLLNYGLIGGLCLALLLAIFIYRSYQIKRKANEVLTEKNTVISQQNEEIKAQHDDISAKNATLANQNEEIRAQRDNIEAKNNELALQKEEIEAQRDTVLYQQKEIESSILYAKHIQEAMLPKNGVIQQEFPEFFILYKPLHIVSGDFYWFSETNPLPIYQDLSTDGGNHSVFQGFEETKFVIAVIDCTGHGVPGAFMSMLGRAALTQIIQHENITEADQILKALNLTILQILDQEAGENKDGMEMALMIIDKANQTLDFAGAKNSLVYIQNGEITEVKGDAFSVGGAFTHARATYTNHQIDISQPTVTYLFSDGFQDQFGGNKMKKFKKANLKKLLLEHHQSPMPEQKQMLETTLHDWMTTSDQSQIDDITLMGVRVS